MKALYIYVVVESAAHGENNEMNRHGATYHDVKHHMMTLQNENRISSRKRGSVLLFEAR